SSIDNLIDFRRLMLATSHRVGHLINQTELGRDVQLPQPTVRRWLNLLETSYQLVRLPAYSVNRTKRLMKTPKGYWCDTGLALHLAGAHEPSGSHLENLILGDLLAWRGAQLVSRPELYYWRTRAGEEVDLVIERNGRLVGIEVKATARPRLSDAQHLRTFREEYGDSVSGCLLLHGGERLGVMAPGVLAAPWWSVI
ncbi:MAG: ATP-binding protein, partial [Longimicrobiales bacterium]